MKFAVLVSVVVTLIGAKLMTAPAAFAADTAKVDLTKWTAPDIASVGDDPFGKLVKYGHALISDTANQPSPRSLTVRLTPSTATEPFCTR